MDAGATGRTTIEVGVDLVAIGDVEAALVEFGERYKARLFTAREQADCERGGRAAAASYAARFAAKEAVLKVLAPTDVRPPWTDIEVVRRASGACRVTLHGAGQRLARRRRLAGWSVSLSHEAGVAVALVAAQRAPAVTKGRSR